jgi:hypothetical protein
MDSEAAARWCPGRGRRDGGDDRWVPAVSDSRRRRGAAGGGGPADLGQVGREAALGRCTGGSGRGGLASAAVGPAGCCGLLLGAGLGCAGRWAGLRRPGLEGGKG